MPRVLILGEFPTLNGGERSLLACLPHIQTAGWVVDFACPATGPLADELQLRGIEIVADLTRSADASRRDDDRYDRIAAAVRNRPYDLVHANSLSTAVLAGPIQHDFGVPTIGHLRDIVRLSGRKIAWLNLHSRLLAVSDATRMSHVAQGLDPAKAFVLYNGVDLQEFHPAEPSGDLHHELALPADAQLVGLVGQIILRKGFDVALTALARMMQSRPRVHVVIVGARHSEKAETVEFERRLHAITAEARIADRVHWLGTRDDVPQILRELTLLLHTPRQEPLGRVLLEAAASGAPVVATDVGGTREIFPQGMNDGAILVPVDNPTAAAAACSQILDDAELRTQLSSAGRRRVDAAFDVKTAAAGLLRHYAEVATL